MIGEYFMKKMVKKCIIKLYLQRANVVTENSFYREPDTDFHGDKNDVMSYLRKYLIKNNDFTGKLLTNTLNEINKSSNVYKSLGEGTYETIVHAFNPRTEILYTFKIKYEVKRMPDMPNDYKTNNRGENLYEKRLIQRCGGDKLARYKQAIQQVNTHTLLELLSPMINEQFKDKVSVKFLENNGLEFNYPEEFRFTPSDNLTITVKFNRWLSRIVSDVDIIYNGYRVSLLDTHSARITEEKITEALNIAKKFDEICEIVKKAYNL